MAAGNEWVEQIPDPVGDDFWRIDGLLGAYNNADSDRQAFIRLLNFYRKEAIFYARPIHEELERTEREAKEGSPGR